MRIPVLLLTVLVSASVILTAGCGDGDDAASPTSSTAPTLTSGTDTTEPAGPSVTAAPSTDSTTPSSQTMVDTTTLPGIDFDLAPPRGRVPSVIGVSHDDTLNVRLLPGADQDVAAELSPVAADFEATGRARLLTGSIWFEITTSDAVTGWVNSSFVAQAGPVFDVTSDVVDRLGEIPVADTMADLGSLVAETLAPTESDEPSRVTMTVAPTVGDLGEITYDLVGLADDATYGLRLHVFGQPTGSGQEFSLKSVEATDMCVPIRGGTPGGLCS